MTDTFRIELSIFGENLRLKLIRQNQEGVEFTESIDDIELSKLQVPCRCADSKAKIHASTIEARETQNEFRATLNNATSQYDPASLEAGERSMRGRAAKVALDFGEVFRVRHRSSYAEGYTDASDTIAQAICALSSTVEPTAHNSSDAGSTPAGRTK